MNDVEWWCSHRRRHCHWLCHSHSRVTLQCLLSCRAAHNASELCISLYHKQQRCTVMMEGYVSQRHSISINIVSKNVDTASHRMPTNEKLEEKIWAAQRQWGWAIESIKRTEWLLLQHIGTYTYLVLEINKPMNMLIKFIIKLIADNLCIYSCQTQNRLFIHTCAEQALKQINLTLCIEFMSNFMLFWSQ